MTDGEVLLCMESGGSREILGGRRRRRTSRSPELIEKQIDADADELKREIKAAEQEADGS